MFTRKEIDIMMRDFSLIASCQTGKRIRVVNATDGELGYTSDDNAIHVALQHEMYNDLTKTETFVFIRGVFSHELLHQLITNFGEYFPAIRIHKACEQSIFAEILNICEDSAIEFFAPEYLSEEYVHSLEVVRSNIYKHQPELQTVENPFGQFVTAMLHYRFFGFLKGHFTDTQAADIFAECVPYLYQVAEEPVQKKRIEYAQKIMDASMPLWKEEAEHQQEMQEFFEQLRKQFGFSLNKGTSEGSDTSDPEQGDSSLSKRRKITFRRVSPEEYKKAMENTKEDGEMPADGDIEVLIPDSPVEEEKKDSKNTTAGIASASTPEDKKEKDESSGAESSGQGDGNEGDKDEASDSSDESDNSDHFDDSQSPSEKSETAQNSSPSDTTQAKKAEDAALSDSGDMTTAVASTLDEYEGSSDALDGEIRKESALTEEELLAIQEICQRALEDSAKEQTKKAKEDVTNFDIPVSGGYENVCKKARCQNIQVKTPNSPKMQTMYNEIVNSMHGQITGLASKLKRIFKNRQEERMYKQSGKISIKRMNCGRVTSRVFTKRKLPDAAELAVVIAVDISGSMGGSKIATARNVTIALAEVFGMLDIPLYVFGFTADDEGFDVNHYHYLNWSNQKADRLNLLSISSHSDNFDGYSIRYAAELIRKKDAEKKLIFVISDGMPAARAYYHISGVQDVRLAVNEANHSATTIGILLGNDVKPETHREMYGYNFIHCANVKDLFPQLSRMLVKSI